MKQISSIVMIIIIGIFIGILINTPSFSQAGEEEVVGLSRDAALQVIAFPLSENQRGGYYMPGVDLSRTYLPNVQFQQSTLIRANFNEAILVNADFRQSSLIQVDFSDANLQFAEFENANLDEANLEGANLHLADLSSTNLNSASLQGANFAGAVLEDAILPDGTTYQEGDDLVTRFGAAANP